MKGKRIAYIRVSTKEQNTIRQEELIKKYNIDKIFIEKVSGKNLNRPQLNKLLDYVREGDTLIVESYSRLARNTTDLLNIVEKLKQRDVGFISLKEQIDTTTPQGTLMFTIFAGISQFERECILQRQREGIEQAKLAGKYKGRKPIDLPQNFKDVYKLWKQGDYTAVTAQKKLNLTPATFYRKVKKFEQSLL